MPCRIPKDVGRDCHLQQECKWLDLFTLLRIHKVNGTRKSILITTKARNQMDA
jgi:hypothetical protein